MSRINITKYLNDGWIIMKEYSEEKVCTWNSFPATKGCNMVRDNWCEKQNPKRSEKKNLFFK